MYYKVPSAFETLKTGLIIPERLGDGPALNPNLVEYPESL
jgi:hypothetical protein